MNSGPPSSDAHASSSAISLSSVNLDNCDQEPIHIPGYIQPHGVLLAFALDGRLVWRSANAPALFPLLPPLGEVVTAAHFAGAEVIHEAMLAMREEALQDDGAAAPNAIEWTRGPEDYDVVLHAFAGHVLVECEHRSAGQGELHTFALKAHRSVGRLRNRRDIGAMLDEAVSTVREITGFDRVMAYRFHHDDSGEVVAESRVEGIEPYVGRRFPASDIPAQARRLYTINTLRLIADVNDRQLPIEAAPGVRIPLDLSHSVLRSVSPIHIEYLKNIDVAASMSVSIVVGGRLWGLIACHHRAPHRVPYAVRMACDVLSQVVSSSVQTALERVGASRRSAAADMRAKLVEIMLHGEDSVEEVGQLAPALPSVIDHDAIVFAQAGRQFVLGGISADAASLLLRWIGEQPEDLVSTNHCDQLPAPVREAIAPFCGVLGLRFDRIGHGALVFLRREQTQTITWSGPPDKIARIGPLGERLTPGGSFAEWRQVVKGTAVPFDETDLAIARQMLDEIGRATVVRAAELERARARLLAVLGHDLRDPLQTIKMAARILEQGDGGSRVGQRISASTGRMGRLITQVLDMSRLHGGLGLGLRLVPHDLVALVRGLIEEASIAHPNVRIDAQLPASLVLDIDADRIAQVVGNLISNARHHGALGQPIRVHLDTQDQFAHLRISNVAEPIPEATQRVLFEPLKAGSVGNVRNPQGLGLGLYIAGEIARGHGGRIDYGWRDGWVEFTVALPLGNA